MATFQKRGDTWRVIVRKSGIVKSATFPTKAHAQTWATKTEADILAGKSGNIPNKTFGDLLTIMPRMFRSRKKANAGMLCGSINLSATLLL